MGLEPPSRTQRSRLRMWRFIGFGELGGGYQLQAVAQLQLGLLVRWMAGGDGPAAFQLGIQLGPKQDGSFGQPQPTPGR